MTKRTFGLAGLLLLGLTALAWAQGGGGAFVPSFSYIVTGQWTWVRAIPWVLEGAVDNAFEDYFSVTEPTQDNTITIPNISGTIMLANTSTGAATKIAGGLITLDGSNPSSATTGLNAIQSCTVNMHRSSNALTDPIIFTTITTASAGRLDVYAWKFTSTSVTTLASSTDASAQVEYICIGS